MEDELIHSSVNPSSNITSKKNEGLTWINHAKKLDLTMKDYGD